MAFDSVRSLVSGSFSDVVFAAGSVDPGPLTRLYKTIVPMAMEPRHGVFKLAACTAMHLSYFFLIKNTVPSMGKDRKRLSWLLTIVTTTWLTLWALYILATSNLRTIFHPEIPYELYDSIDSRTGNLLYHRQDVIYNMNAPSMATWSEPHTKLIWNDIAHENSTNSRDVLLSNSDIVFLASKDDTVCHASQLAQPNYLSRAQFYAAIDSKHLQSTKSPFSSFPWFMSYFRLPHRLFFDMRFMPLETAASEWVVALMGTYLLLDLIIGWIYYKEKLTIVGAYIHHTFFFFACIVTIRANQTMMHAIYHFAELPLVIMGVGYLYKPLRNDFLFGATFFLLRLVYDPLLTHEMLFNRPDFFVIGQWLISLKLPLYAKFFYDFVRQQQRLRKKENALLAASKRDGGAKVVSGLKTGKLELVK
ncbi:hypothetical protein BGZ94_006397 [Podila epigama]|nr:hypothetical protein BGZ94_006397 [Podila epigama]